MKKNNNKNEGRDSVSVALKEHDCVVLTEDYEHYKKGMLGTIIHIYGNASGDARISIIEISEDANVSAFTQDVPLDLLKLQDPVPVKPETHGECVVRWNRHAEQHLLGRTIIEVRYQTNEEMETQGWTTKALMIVFDNGSYIFPVRDDEGNDAGALFCSGLVGFDSFPVLRP